VEQTQHAPPDLAVRCDKTNTPTQLTIDVFLLGWYLFLGGRFADELGKPLSGQAVFSRRHSIYKALSGNIRTVQKFVYIHR